jgi:hypothetical protein
MGITRGGGRQSIAHPIGPAVPSKRTQQPQRGQAAQGEEQSVNANLLRKPDQVGMEHAQHQRQLADWSAEGDPAN